MCKTQRSEADSYSTEAVEKKKKGESSEYSDEEMGWEGRYSEEVSE